MNSEIGKQINRLRTAAGLTVKQLGERAGVPWRTLQNCLQGRHELRLSAAAAVADVLGVSLDEIFGRKIG